jgi:hypothetical protein
VFDATFNNISVISWPWMKQEDSGKTTDLSQVTDKLYHMQKLKKMKLQTLFFYKTIKQKSWIKKIIQQDMRSTFL